MIPEINLLPDKESQFDRFTVIFYLLVALWIVLTGLFIFQNFHAKKEIKQLTNQTEQLTAEKDVLERELADAAGGLAEQLRQSVTKLDQMILSTSKVLTGLVFLLPDEHSYLSEYTYNGDEVTVQTQFETLDGVAEYVAELNSSKYFSDVKVESVETFNIENADEEGMDVSRYFRQLPRYDARITAVIEPESLLPPGGEKDE